MAYDPGISGFDPEARAEADVDLIRGISHIPNGHLDAEAAIYAGLATLVTIAIVETGSHSELLSDREDVRYATGALKDIQRGLDDLTPAELQVAAPIVEAAVQSLFSLFDFAWPRRTQRSFSGWSDDVQHVATFGVRPLRRTTQGSSKPFQHVNTKAVVVVQEP
jgi:hypothetical protein